MELLDASCLIPSKHGSHHRAPRKESRMRKWMQFGSVQHLCTSPLLDPLPGNHLLHGQLPFPFQWYHLLPMECWLGQSSFLLLPLHLGTCGFWCPLYHSLLCGKEFPRSPYCLPWQIRTRKKSNQCSVLQVSQSDTIFRSVYSERHAPRNRLFHGKDLLAPMRTIFFCV